MNSMRDIPTVTVIMPMFNQRPDFLRASIESVLSQTYPAVELVVSDNHSTNGAKDVLSQISDPRMTVVRPAQFLPMVEHFCFAADQARGTYISFLPSDDLIEPNCYADLVPILEGDSRADFAFGETAGVAHEAPDQVLYYNRDNTMPSGSYSIPEILKIMIPFGRSAGWLVGGIVRRDAYSQSGGIGRDNMRYAADHALALRLLERGSAVYLNRLVGRHRCWGHGEGKVDGNRSYAAIVDTQRLYEILDTSSALQSYVAKLGPEIKVAKRKKAAILSLVLLEGMALRNLARDQFNEARDRILSLDSSAATRTLLALAGSPAASVVGAVRKPARALYHATLGPYLNRI